MHGMERVKSVPFFLWRGSPHSDTTVDRVPLDEGSVRRINLYLTTYKACKRQAFMPPAGFEPAIRASEWPQIVA